jgi:hypothetical protein
MDGNEHGVFRSLGLGLSHQQPWLAGMQAGLLGLAVEFLAQILQHLPALAAIQPLLQLA